MNTIGLTQLLLGLTLALAGPWFALAYLRAYLLRVLRSLCHDQDGALFWWRVLQVQAVAGSLLLMLVCGASDTNWVDWLRRDLAVTAVATFVSVGLVARRIWAQLARLQTQARTAPRPVATP